MKKSYLVYGVVVGLGVLLIGGCQRPDRVGVDEVEEIVPVSLNVGDTSLPDGLVKAVETVLGAGLWEVEGARFVDFKVAYETENTAVFRNTAVPGADRNAVYQGWIQDYGEDMNVVLGMDGGIYLADAIIRDTELTEDSRGPGEPVAGRNSFYHGSGRAPGWLGRTAVLLAAGKVEWAEKVYAETTKNFPNGTLFDENNNPLNSLASTAYSDLVSVASVGLQDGHYSTALEMAKRANKVTRMLSAPVDPVYPTPPFVEYSSALVKDLERRLTEKGSVDLAKIQQMPMAEKRAALREAMDEIEYSQMTGQGDPVYEAIVAEGEGMIPDLISAFGSDERLSKSLGVHRVGLTSGQRLRPVSEIAGEILGRVWEGMPQFSAIAVPGDRVAVAAEFHTRWERDKNAPLARRLYWNVTSMKVADYAALRDLQALNRAAPVAGRGNYVPGRIPILLDQLTEEERQKLAGAVAERVQRTIQERQPGGAISTGDLALELAHLEGKRALPALQQYTQNLMAMLSPQTGQRPNWNQYGPPLGAVVAQRMALGDVENALIDYRTAMRSFDDADSMASRALRPAWEFPENEEVQRIAVESLRRAEKRYEEEQDGRSLSLGFFTHGGQRLGSVMKAPGIRRFFSEQLENTTVVGTVKIDDRQGGKMYQVTGTRTHLSGGVPSQSQEPLVQGESPVTAGEVAAHEITNGMERGFFIGWTPAKRKAALAALIRDLKSPSYDWGSEFGRQFYGELETKIYRP